MGAGQGNAENRRGAYLVNRIGHVVASAAAAAAAWFVLGIALFLVGFAGRDPWSVLRYDLVPAPFTRLETVRWVFSGWIVALWAVGVAQLVALARAATGRWRAAGDWAVLLAPLVLAGAMLVHLAASGMSPRIGTLEGFERMSGMRLPAGTVLLEARGYNGFKAIVQARVRMPRSALQPFLHSSFAGGVPRIGLEQRGLTIEHMQRGELARWPYLLYDNWRPPAADRLLVANAATFGYGDSYEALAVAPDNDDPFIEVALQYARG